MPQAKFFYRFDPFTIHVKDASKPWYEFVVVLMALLGGGWITLEIILNFLQASRNRVVAKEGSGMGDAGLIPLDQMGGASIGI